MLSRKKSGERYEKVSESFYARRFSLLASPVAGGKLRSVREGPGRSGLSWLSFRRGLSFEVGIFADLLRPVRPQSLIVRKLSLRLFGAPEAAQQLLAERLIVRTSYQLRQ